MSFAIKNKPINSRNTRGQTKGRYKEASSWEASLTQRGNSENQLKEATLKAHCSTSNCDYSKLNSKRTISKSPYDLLVEKEASKKLNSSERLSLQIYRDRNKEAIEADLLKLKNHGLAANVSTDHGRIIKLLLCIEHNLASEKVTKWEDIYYISRKLLKFNIPDEIKTNKDYAKLFQVIELIHTRIDTIGLQFTKYHGSMPPIDVREFKELDSWQKDFLDFIDANKSVIVQASTSAGKSVVTGYVFVKKSTGKKRYVIVIVPTDALVWQTASMIGKITDQDIPIITKTYQSETVLATLIKKIEECGIVVGTARDLNDYLPLINVEWDLVVIDEIHMIDRNEMEIACKVYNNIPIILLSATIGNVEYLRDWLLSIGHKSIEIIKCEKRFLNLQRLCFRKSNTLTRIHPLSSIVLSDIESGSVLEKTLNATPPDIWDLAINLKEKCKIGSLDPYKYFTQTQVITLDEASLYFKLLLEWMVTNYTENKTQITSIISSYIHEDIDAVQIPLYNVAKLLFDQDKTPALFFQLDSHKCLEYIKQLSKTIREEENKAYPHLLKERLKEQSRAKSYDKKIEQMKIDGMGEKKIQKLLMAGTFEETPSENIAIYEPHLDFIFNKNQYFTQHVIDGWNKELKKYFPANGSEYHYIIDLLWRGIGIYVKGLPDPYLSIVQNLACGGKLGIVFSDDSLVFGVSMPFRTTVITAMPFHTPIMPDKLSLTPDLSLPSPTPIVISGEKIDSMMYHQMAGRAGRRGLDKEGNVVFVGYSWKDIQTLSTSVIPNIKGRDTMFYGSIYATKLSKDKRWENITSNFLLDKITNEDAKEFYDEIKANLSPSGGWSFAMNDNIHFLHMAWRLRHSEDCFRVPFLISFIRKIFCNANASNENTQIELAKFLLNYIDVVEAKDSKVLTPAESSKQYNISKHLEQLGLDVPNKIDSRLYECIQLNSLIELSTREKSIIRERLFNFAEKIRTIQHYFHHMKEIVHARLFSKLLTRIMWIYHMSSPVMESTIKYDLSDSEED
jgi:superfamily II RNA helicase